MRRLPTLVVAVALLAGMTVQAVQAAPLRTAQLRAHRCCASRCQRTASLGEAMRCCRVAPATAPVVSLSAGNATPDPGPVVLVTIVFPAPSAAPGTSFPAETGRSSRAGPRVLETRSLRL